MKYENAVAMIAALMRGGATLIVGPEGDVLMVDVSVLSPRECVAAWSGYRCAAVLPFTSALDSDPETPVVDHGPSRRSMIDAANALLVAGAEVVSHRWGSGLDYVPWDHPFSLLMVLSAVESGAFAPVPNGDGTWSLREVTNA